jgi:pimeloyl-ACP methyl ester carboxylesterase
VTHHVWQIPSTQNRLIVLLHGFGASCFSWSPVIAQLSKYGEVFAYDRAGFGFTERVDEPSVYGFEFQLQVIQDIVATQSKGRPVVLIGHSAGGQLAAEFALRNPSMVSALVLEDPAILLEGGPPEQVTRLLRGTAFQKLGPKLVSNFGKTGDKILLNAWHDKSKLTKETWDGYHAPMADPLWPAAFWKFVTAPRSARVTNRLAEVKTPALVITGEHDKIVAPKYSRQAAEQLPNAIFVEVPNCGHLPHEETPTEFLAAVGDFLNSF